MSPHRLRERRLASGPTALRTQPTGVSGRASSALQGGFTLLELIIVMAIIGILATVALPRMKDMPRRAQEAALKQNLHTMRDLIDQFYADKGHYPPSLQALADEGYIRGIPVDPITKSAETWIEVFEEVAFDEYAAETDLAEGGAPGVWDVQSGSEELSLNGETYYSEW